MRKAAFSFIVLALAAFASPAAAKPPVIVELFTAQGCSSCIKASAHVADLADKDGVLPLTFSVDYWDYLGWTDTFARPEFTERQKAYAKRIGLREVYTPQVVVDGRRQVSGGQAPQVDALVKQAARAAKDPPDMLYMENGKIAVGSSRYRLSGGGEVWLVRYDPRPAQVEVKKGDNKGETVEERNVVRQLVRLGRWRGRPTAFRLPPASDEGLETVVLVQQSGGGRIVAALKQPSR
jgi:hypothetical protein